MAEEQKFENGDPFDLDKLFGEGKSEKPETEPLPGEESLPNKIEEREVKVVGVYEHPDAVGGQATPFVLLRDNKGRSVLIWIGRFEAASISMAIEGIVVERPLTHDLIRNIIDKIGWKIERILIDDLFNETYYAKITVVRNGDTMDIDSRPSDAIAIGLRVRAPIYMAETVLEQAAVNEDL